MFLIDFLIKFVFFFSIHKTKFDLCFVVFVDSTGGTSGKRVPGGLFDKVFVLIFDPKNRVSSMFLKFL